MILKFRSSLFKGLRVWAEPIKIFRYNNLSGANSHAVCVLKLSLLKQATAIKKIWLYVNSWGNPKNEIEIFNKWQKIKLSLVFAIDRQTYAKYDCENA